MGWRTTLASLRGRVKGDDTPAEVARARAASSSRDWDAAAHAWEQVLGTPAADVLGPEPWIELGRAHRLRRDLTAARDVVERGHAAFPDELGLAVERARLALRGYSASAEDERHVWKALLLDAEAALRSARERGKVTKPSLQAAGEIELARRRWREAVALWQMLAKRYPDHRDEALLKQATALRSAGDLTGARAALGQVSDAATVDAVRAEERAITAKERVAAATELFSAASSRWHAGETDVLRREVTTALEWRGHRTERIARALPLLDDLAGWLDAAAGDAPLEATGGPDASDALIGDVRDAVLVSGFLYSGSGAVFDFLRQYDRFHRTFEDKETGFLKKPGHLATILESRSGDRFPNPATVADAVLASTFGFGQSGRPLMGWAVRNEAAVDRLIGQLRWLVADLRRTWAQHGHDRGLAEPMTTAALRTFLDAVVADLTPPDHIALLNNAIVGHQLQHLRLLSRPTAVAVLRDPRDQYVSQRLESPFALSCDDFTAMMADRYDAFSAVRADPALRERVVGVRFERFVEETVSREALLDRLGVADRTASAGETTFDAERSRLNIGIHRTYTDQHEIRQVATALLERYEDLTGSW